MALGDELLQFRMALKGNREVDSGLKKTRENVDKLGKTQDQTTRSTTRTDRATGRLTKTYSALGRAARWGLGFLGVGGLFALKESITNTLELSKTTAGLARNLGLTTREASRWAGVAHARDIDSKSLTMSFTTLSRQLVTAARDGGTAMDVFRDMGLTQKEVKRGADDFNWGLMRIATAFGEAEGGALRQASAQKLLGRGYQSILPLFTEGTKSLRDQLGWADKYGLTLTDKTNEPLEKLVSLQRESKVAMLALQVGLVRTLAPALSGAHEELQLFVSTLNSDKLSADEKISRISDQFNRISNMIVDAVIDAIPKASEKAGQMGVKVAVGFARGFMNAPAIGKLAIGLWLITRMGGWGLIGKTGGKVGTRLGKALGMRFLAAVAPALAADIAGAGLGAVLSDQMTALKGRFGRAGTTLGTSMGKGTKMGFLAGFSIVGLMAFMFTRDGQRVYEFGYGIGEKIRNGIKDAITDTLGDAAGSIFDTVTKPAPWLQGITGGWTGGLITPQGVEGYAQGGPILDRRDKIPIMAADGEFMMRKSAVDRFGLPFMQAINRGRVPDPTPINGGAGFGVIRLKNHTILQLPNGEAIAEVVSESVEDEIAFS